MHVRASVYFHVCVCVCVCVCACVCVFVICVCRVFCVSMCVCLYESVKIRKGNGFLTPRARMLSFAYHAFCSLHDASLRGEHQRVKQGNAFTMIGYSNWKKQCCGIARHEGSNTHQNAVLAQAILLQELNA